MAENEQGQEKTEEATAKRIEDARNRGQIPRSRELNTVLMMVGSAISFIVFGGFLIEGLLDVLKNSFSLSRAEVFDPKYLLILLQQNILHGLSMAAPFFLVTIVIAIFASISIGGWNFALQAMQPKFSKMNPLKGLQRIFGVKGLVELVKAIGKVLLVGVAAALMLVYLQDALMLMGYQALVPALKNLSQITTVYFAVLGLSLIVVALIDAPFQMWDHKRQLRMSKDEVKQEHKQTEGSPETKMRVRQAQRAMAQKRMMEKVPQADVVITNPTHFAVALKYDQSGGGAPVVVAKGADLVAQRIREVAREHRVPLVSSPALARAIFFSTELDQEIPTGLYTAVAKILAYIFQLREKAGVDLSKPISMTDVDVPDEFVH